MKRRTRWMLTILGAGALFTSMSFAAETAPPAKAGSTQDFEKHRAEVLARIDARIARNQEERSCVQGAKDSRDVRSCQEKFRAQLKEERQRAKAR